MLVVSPHWGGLASDILGFPRVRALRPSRAWQTAAPPPRCSDSSASCSFCLGCTGSNPSPRHTRPSQRHSPAAALLLALSSSSSPAVQTSLYLKSEAQAEQPCRLWHGCLSGSALPSTWPCSTGVASLHSSTNTPQTTPEHIAPPGKTAHGRLKLSPPADHGTPSPP